MMTKEEKKAKRNAWLKKRREAGFCVQCSKHCGKGLCDKCRIKARPYIRKYGKKPEVRAARLAWQRKKSAERKAIVFAHYGNRCDCCGETMQEFLTIDHKEKNGNNDPRCHYPGKPKKFRVTGGRWYHLIIRLGFPTDLRLLCWNCNHAEHIYGTCPHRITGTSVQSLGA